MEKNSKFIDTHTTPIGVLTITANNQGITKIDFGSNIKKANPNNIIKKCKKELDSYFNGSLKKFTVPISEPQTKNFTTKVWKKLTSIPYGKTSQYGQLAKELGSEKAARAVGNACNKNPVPIIIPCHRVLGKNGKLTGFRGGLDKKELLLKHEQSRNQ